MRIPAHLSLDPEWGGMTVIEFGRVWDGQPDSHFDEFDESLTFMRSRPRGRIVAFHLSQPHDFAPEDWVDAEIWETVCFDVPVLGVRKATVGEIVLAVQGRFGREEPTLDAGLFHAAIDAQEQDDYETAESLFRGALEAGDMKARFGVGYSLVELERYREAYDHLRIYAELTPHNAWAWCWLGKACEGLGEVGEARNTYRRAIQIERRGGWATDARELLEELSG